MNEDVFPIENGDFPVCHVKTQDIEQLNYTIRYLDIKLALKSALWWTSVLLVFMGGIFFIWMFPKIVVPPNHPF